MSRYLANKTVKDFNFDPSVKTATYCEITGRLADTDICGPKKTGYYAPNNMPGGCGGNHSYVNNGDANTTENPQNQSSESSSVPSSSSEQSSSSNVSSIPGDQTNVESKPSEKTIVTSSEENTI